MYAPKFFLYVLLKGRGAGKRTKNEAMAARMICTNDCEPILAVLSLEPAAASWGSFKSTLNSRTIYKSNLLCAQTRPRPALSRPHHPPHRPRPYAPPNSKKHLPQPKPPVARTCFHPLLGLLPHSRPIVFVFHHPVASGHSSCRRLRLL